MRKYICKLFILLSVMIATLSFTSCNESKFLEQTPLDFYSISNSMTTVDEFQTSLNFLYNDIRQNVWSLNNTSYTQTVMFYSTDLAYRGESSLTNLTQLDDYKNKMVPTTGFVEDTWQEWYDLIFASNVIISQAETAKALTDSDRKRITGEALFFRAYSYNILADLFGGVPLVTSEITAPSRDYVRATREEVYAQVKLDLETAASYLDDIDNVADGKVSKQAVQHLLAQACISLKDYDAAIAAATAVIDHSSMALMTNRFGTYVDREGDVYWDLFREGNQNRSTSGNTESIFVLQYDYLSAGSPTSWQIGYFVIPRPRSMKIDGVLAFLDTGITQEKGGRGTGLMRPTHFFFNELWESDFDNDIRNSDYNIMRDTRVDNPKNPQFGKWLVADGVMSENDTLRNWYPVIKKVVSTTFPSETYKTNSDGSTKMTEFGETVLTTMNCQGYKDTYLFRLAETYLLRAEAYLGDGNTTAAAADINVVRDRANASQITASDVDIDYILDERMRELHFEELRMAQLCRLGKHYERTKKYNNRAGQSIQEYHNLWPIPYREIESNVYTTLEQNPGYTN